MVHDSPFTVHHFIIFYLHYSVLSISFKGIVELFVLTFADLTSPFVQVMRVVAIANSQPKPVRQRVHT